MAKTICLLNFKGGVGKTTVAINLAAALNRRNRVGDDSQHNRVLVIDMDVQCTATSAYKPKTDEQREKAEPITQTVYEALTRKTDEAGNSGLPIYESNTKGIDFVPSSPEMKFIENDMARNREKSHVLQDLLSPQALQDEYEYIIIDCPPGEGVETDNAMIAADYILVPVKCQEFSVQGLVNIMSEVKDVQRRSNPKLKVLGIVCNELDMVRRKSGIIEPKSISTRQIYNELKNCYGELMFNTYIRQNIAVAEFGNSAHDIFEYQPDSHGAADFTALANEVETRITNEKL